MPVVGASIEFIKNRQMLVADSYGICKLNSDKNLKIKSYYKESILFDSSVIQEFEAIINIYKTSYSEKNNDKLELKKTKININDTAHILWDYIYFTDGPYEADFADLAKYPYKFIQIPNSNINFFDPDFSRFYNYKLFETINEFIIDFKPDMQKKRDIFEGKISIKKHNFEILYVFYKYSPERLEKIKNNPTLTDINLYKEGIYMHHIKYESNVFYKNINGYLLHCSITLKYSYEFGMFKNKKISKVEVTDILITKSVEPFTNKNSFKIKQIPKSDNIIKRLPDSGNFSENDKNNLCR